MKKLLLHACCAPDATVAVERLREKYDITVYFYNPCIAPEEEYAKREKDARLVAGKMTAGYVRGDYKPEEFLDLVKGLENEPEKGKRCLICYRMRLRAAARHAVLNGFDYFTTTLTVSPHKNADVINNIGREIEKTSRDAINRVCFLELDLKKQDGFKRSLELSRELNLYRQNYCGCVFSRKATM